MAAGVTLEDPDTAYVDPDVTIGRDTVIGPNVHLRGRTAIGEGCRVDGSAFITDSVIGDGSHLRFGVVITESSVGARCEIGPFDAQETAAYITHRTKIAGGDAPTLFPRDALLLIAPQAVVIRGDPPHGHRHAVDVAPGFGGHLG